MPLGGWAPREAGSLHSARLRPAPARMSRAPVLGALPAIRPAPSRLCGCSVALDCLRSGVADIAVRFPRGAANVAHRLARGAADIADRLSCGASDAAECLGRRAARPESLPADLADVVCQTAQRATGPHSLLRRLAQAAGRRADGV